MGDEREQGTTHLVCFVRVREIGSGTARPGQGMMKAAASNKRARIGLGMPSGSGISRKSVSTGEVSVARMCHHVDRTRRTWEPVLLVPSIRTGLISAAVLVASGRDLRIEDRGRKGGRVRTYLLPDSAPRNTRVSNKDTSRKTHRSLSGELALRGEAL